MKRTFLILVLFVAAIPAVAQSNFLIGGRYSNYSTDVSLPGFDLETGRQSSIGFLAQLRTQQLVLKGSADNDLGGSLSISELLPFEFDDYSRDRLEFSVGYAPTSFLDLDAGVRIDNFTIRNNVFGNEFFADEDLEHQALLFGLNVHSETIRPIGWYVSARGYVGSADVDVPGTSPSIDTTGYKLEAGLPLAIGTSGWEITPAFELEQIDLDEEEFPMEIATNRFIVNFAYSWGR